MDITHSTLVSLSEFYDMLERHDWMGQLSDSGAVQNRTYQERQAINTIAKQSEAHTKLLDDYQAYLLAPKRKKPARPEDKSQ